MITHDTIAAVITPPGEGGIAALRLAGPRCRAIIEKHVRDREGHALAFQPFHLYLADFHAADSSARLDQIMAVFMPSGHSYTGLDQIEIFCHGGRLVTRRILESLLQSGARAAEPGEFTKLAFLNGRIDLAEAEAVAELIAAGTARALAVSQEHLLGAYSEHIAMLRDSLLDLVAQIETDLDFVEEGIPPATTESRKQALGATLAQVEKLIDSYKEGRIVREGFMVAIAGRPNAGKSSLFNRLLSQDRALVTPTAGTTRDYLSEWIELDGYAVNFVDTAGLRPKAGKIERHGQSKARGVLKKADLIIWLVDISNRSWQRNLEIDRLSLPKVKTLTVANKNDLARKGLKHGLAASISCKTGIGLGDIKSFIVNKIHELSPDRIEGHTVTSERHKQKLSDCRKSLHEAKELLVSDSTLEIAAVNIRSGITCLDEIIGRVYTEEVLGRIFSRFCIGK